MGDHTIAAPCTKAPWYDTLARVTDIETLVTVDGAVRSLDYFTSGENGGEPERPETIAMHLNVLHPPKSPRHCFRKCDTIAVPADLAFTGGAWSSVHDALPLVTADSDIAPEELARLLRAGFFSPSDDVEADSWETQLTRFEEDAHCWARVRVGTAGCRGFRVRGRACWSPGLRECGTGRGHPLRHPPSPAFGSSSGSCRRNGTGWGRNGWTAQGQLNPSPPFQRRAGRHGQPRCWFDTRHEPSGWRQALPWACPVRPPAVTGAGIPCSRFRRPICRCGSV